MKHSEIQEKLSEWAGERQDSSSTFIRRISDVLGSTPQQKLWAFIDIRREFESLVDEPEDLVAPNKSATLRNIIRGLLPILYVFPILVTWAELALAVSSYRQEVRTNPSKTVDFLAVWSKVDGNHGGLGFQTAAFIIAGCILAIISAHVLNYLTTRFINNLARVRIDEANTLLLETQLLLVKSRAVTPEEMADSLTTAGSLLQEALLEVAEVLPRFEGISSGLSNVVSGIATASQSLDETSRFIRQSTDALSDLPTRIAPLTNVLNDAPAAMRNTLEDFIAITSEATQSNGRIASAAQGLAQTTMGIASELSALGVEIEGVSRQVSETMSFVASLPKSLGEHAKVAIDLSKSLESATPVAVVFKDGVAQMTANIEALGQMVAELKYAAEQYGKANDQHRQQY